MKYLITAPAALTKNEITLPASKSISNRLLLLNALSYSPYEIENLSESDDTRVMKHALNSNSNTFDVGAAGTSMRFLTAFLSKIMGEWVITGSERMKQRPIKILVDALNQLGAKIEYLEKEGFPPLRILGSALTGGTIELPGNISSQYISALMMIAPEVRGGLQIKLTGKIISKPYIEMTLQLMDLFGVRGFWKNETITIPEGNYKPVKTTIESDWSAASYWYEMVALQPGAEMTLLGLHKKSYQGDSNVVHIFESLGVKTHHSSSGTLIKHCGQTTSNFKYNFTDQPDLAQTVAATCCCLGIHFHFTGLESLKIKETDRINALIVELGKLGFVLTSNQTDSLVWDGTMREPEKQPVIDTYEDHRMAMAFAPAALKFNRVTINHPMVVTKSYPRYYDDLIKAGFTVDAINE